MFMKQMMNLNHSWILMIAQSHIIMPEMNVNNIVLMRMIAGAALSIVVMIANGLQLPNAKNSEQIDFKKEVPHKNPVI